MSTSLPNGSKDNAPSKKRKDVDPDADFLTSAPKRSKQQDEPELANAPKGQANLLGWAKPKTASASPATSKAQSNGAADSTLATGTLASFFTGRPKSTPVPTPQADNIVIIDTSEQDPVIVSDSPETHPQRTFSIFQKKSPTQKERVTPPKDAIPDELKLKPGDATPSFFMRRSEYKKQKEQANKENQERERQQQKEEFATLFAGEQANPFLLPNPEFAKSVPSQIDVVDDGYGSQCPWIPQPDHTRYLEQNLTKLPTFSSDSSSRLASLFASRKQENSTLLERLDWSQYESWRQSLPERTGGTDEDEVEVLSENPPPPQEVGENIEAAEGETEILEEPSTPKPEPVVKMASIFMRKPTPKKTSAPTSPVSLPSESEVSVDIFANEHFDLIPATVLSGDQLQKVMRSPAIISCVKQLVGEKISGANLMADAVFAAYETDKPESRPPQQTVDVNSASELAAPDELVNSFQRDQEEQGETNVAEIVATMMRKNYTDKRPLRLREIEQESRLLGMLNKNAQKAVSDYRPQFELWVDRFQPSRSEELTGNTRWASFLYEWLAQWKDDSEPEPEMPISFTSRHSSRYDGSDSDEDDDESMDDDDSDDDDDDDDGYKAPGRSSKSRRKRLSGAAGLCHTVIINGPTGAGKTAAVYAIAEELGFQLIVIDQSMNRSGSKFQELIGEATQSHRLTKSHKTVILFEDIDTVSEESDIGFFEGLSNLIVDTKRPIVLTCNVVPEAVSYLDLPIFTWSLIPPSPSSIMTTLQSMCLSQGLPPLSGLSLSRLVSLAPTDIRWCINQLQFWAETSQTSTCESWWTALTGASSTGSLSTIISQHRKTEQGRFLSDSIVECVLGIGSVLRRYHRGVWTPLTNSVGDVLDISSASERDKKAALVDILRDGMFLSEVDTERRLRFVRTAGLSLLKALIPRELSSILWPVNRLGVYVEFDDADEIADAYTRERDLVSRSHLESSRTPPSTATTTNGINNAPSLAPKPMQPKQSSFFSAIKAMDPMAPSSTSSTATADKRGPINLFFQHQHQHQHQHQQPKQFPSVPTRSHTGNYIPLLDESSNAMDFMDNAQSPLSANRDLASATPVRDLTREKPKPVRAPRVNLTSVSPPDHPRWQAAAWLYQAPRHFINALLDRASLTTDIRIDSIRSNERSSILADMAHCMVIRSLWAVGIEMDSSVSALCNDVGVHNIGGINVEALSKSPLDLGLPSIASVLNKGESMVANKLRDMFGSTRPVDAKSLLADDSLGFSKLLAKIEQGIIPTITPVGEDFSAVSDDEDDKSEEDMIPLDQQDTKPAIFDDENSLFNGEDDDNF